MAPIVYSSRRPRTPEAGDGHSDSSHASTPSFRMGSSPSTHGTKALPDDTSYDTSVASAAEKRPTRTFSQELETDLEESDTEAAPRRPTLAGRMRARDEPRDEPLFLGDSDDEQDARRGRMQRLRDLARQRAAQNTDDAPDEPAAPAPHSPPPAAPAPEPLLLDASSESEGELKVPTPPRAKGLSRKEQREMHSMSARLRREHRATIARPEPKRYQLSELLSTIQHAEARPETHSSSDPVESSSTAPRSTPEPSPRRPPVDPLTDPAQERIQRKWAMLRAQKPRTDESDSDVEVVALAEPKKKVLFRPPPRDRDRADADHQLAQLGAAPRTPRKQRIASDVYRSPNADAPSAPPVSDHEMSAAAHAFALAAHKVAGTLPPSSPTHEDPHTSRAPAPRHVPVVMGLEQLNETLLQKSYEQNAQVAAKRGRSRKAAPAAPEDAAHHEVAVHEDAADAAAPSLKTYGRAHTSRDAPRDAPSPTPDGAPSPTPDGAPSPAADDAPSPTSSHSAPSAHGSSEKENVPLSPMLPADEGELDVDLGRFFAPTQVAPASPVRSPPRRAPLQEAVAGGTPRERTQSNSSVLAQFFESTQEQPARGASLDLFANQQRDGPVGGMTQFFEPTPEPSSARPTRSQEAMPPPTRAASTDGFAALRRQQEEDAHAPLSPEVLPSLDPSLAERSDDAWRERRAPSAHDEVMYINQDGFFTQTKPADDAPAPSHPAGPPPSQRTRELIERAASPLDAPLDVPGAEGGARDEPGADAVPEADASLLAALSDSADEPLDIPSDSEGSDGAEDPVAASEARAHWASVLSERKVHGKPRERSAFVFGEAEESDEEDAHGGEHGGLAGVFSDRGSDSEPEEGSEDDADLESLLDDERDENEEEQDEAARMRYQQHRDEDDAAMQALHERAAKGLLRSRRRRLDDPLAELLDEDADEDELRRKLHAPAFEPKRRRIEQDGLQALADREDSRAFVQAYNETHVHEDAGRYDFLGEASSDEERVTAHDLRAEIRQRAQQAPEAQDASSDEEDVVLHKLRPRQAQAAARPVDDDETEYARLLFKAGHVDLSQLPRELQERRARLLEEYSNEPSWRQERGGRHGIDRRRTGKGKRNSVPMPAPPPAAPTHSAPSVLVHNILRREAHFAAPP
ncbi:hypothetical protein MOBT1_003310 [Malassezia obtusa]|uniref:DNA replication checkpoint mediator MRC1 domain-containing protein n=1 Tax=Malassezia obtusa TaxID=76774 RepID=A0AAF0E3X2_9BASI|nr:hypothetical protein MOBT1_003310 [Malassezia obtusa]